MEGFWNRLWYVVNAARRYLDRLGYSHTRGNFAEVKAINLVRKLPESQKYKSSRGNYEQQSCLIRRNT